MVREDKASARLKHKVATIALCGLAGSSNCGDQLIAQALSQALGQSARIIPYDILANRKKRGAWYRLRRTAAALIMPQLPPPLRTCLVTAYAKCVFLLLRRSYYDLLVRSADAVLIGGGQLLRDNDGYMAGAMDALHRAMCRHGRNYAIIGCGASPGWGAYAQKVFRRLLDHPQNRATVLRDEASARVLRDYGIRCPCTVAPDMAFSGGWSKAPAAGAVPAVCTASPYTLAYYGRTGIRGSPRQNRKRMLDEIRRYAAAQKEAGLLLFCNGNPEDFLFARWLQKKLRSMLPQKTICLAAIPHSPEDMARILSRCSCIRSYRMHTAILASLMRIPCTLVPWDAKADSLMLDESHVQEQIDRARTAAASVARIVLQS